MLIETIYLSHSLDYIYLLKLLGSEFICYIRNSEGRDDMLFSNLCFICVFLATQKIPDLK